MTTLRADDLVIRRLRRQLATPDAAVPRTICSSGVAWIDEMLPEGGFRSGSLIEWLGELGSGVSTLVWLLAAHWQSSRSAIVVTHDQRAAALGVRCGMPLAEAQALCQDRCDRAEPRFVCGFALGCHEAEPSVLSPRTPDWNLDDDASAEIKAEGPLVPPQANDSGEKGCSAKSFTAEESG